MGHQADLAPPHVQHSPQSNAASSSRITTERLVPVYCLVAVDMGHTADLVTAHAKKSCAIHCSQQLLTHHHQEASATVRSGGGQTWGTRQIWSHLTHSTPPQSNAASSSHITTGRLVPLYRLVASKNGTHARSGPSSRTALPHNPMEPVPHTSPPGG